jgi:hypothetical protein
MDCTGQAYTQRGIWNDMPARQGIVFWNASPAPGSLYMIQTGTESEVIQVESTSRDGVCTLESVSDLVAYKVIANDPAITGVTQGDFVGEVTLGF